MLSPPLNAGDGIIQKGFLDKFFFRHSSIVDVGIVDDGVFRRVDPGGVVRGFAVNVGGAGFSGTVVVGFFGGFVVGVFGVEGYAVEMWRGGRAVRGEVKWSLGETMRYKGF